FIIGTTFFGASVSLGFGLPIALTVGIIAIAILNIHKHAEQKELIKKIARFEEIAIACQRAIPLFPEHTEQFNETQIKQIFDTVDALCLMRNKRDDSDGILFNSLDRETKNIHKLYNETI